MNPNKVAELYFDQNLTDEELSKKLKMSVPEVRKYRMNNGIVYKSNAVQFLFHEVDMLIKHRLMYIDETLFEKQEEYDLFNAIRKLRFCEDEQFLKELYSIDGVVSNYFNNVLVDDDRDNIRTNRKNLLRILKDIYFIMWDWTKLRNK